MNWKLCVSKLVKTVVVQLGIWIVNYVLDLALSDWRVSDVQTGVWLIWKVIGLLVGVFCWRQSKLDGMFVILSSANRELFSCHQPLWRFKIDTIRHGMLCMLSLFPLVLQSQVLIGSIRWLNLSCLHVSSAEEKLTKIIPSVPSWHRAVVKRG